MNRERPGGYRSAQIGGGEFSLFEKLDFTGLRLIIVETHERLAEKGAAARLDHLVRSQGFDLKEAVQAAVLIYERTVAAAAA